MNKSKPAKIDFTLRDVRLAIIAARFNADIVEGLLNGALDALQRHGVTRRQIRVVRVPGAFEIPLAAKLLSGVEGGYDALIALGAVVRGETPHFEYVCGACTQGLLQTGWWLNMPVGFGVLTVNTTRQAAARARPGANNKGAEAALAALEMIQLKRELGAPPAKPRRR
ncbi:MAG: 6,7-dimethyl-8-ribityllumazine synthase, partial [Gammaproteobacteria bacterium]